MGAMHLSGDLMTKGIQPLMPDLRKEHFIRLVSLSDEVMGFSNDFACGLRV
jgi:hypothetical protein